MECYLNLKSESPRQQQKKSFSKSSFLHLEAPSRYAPTSDQKMLIRAIVSQCANVFMAIKIDHSTTTAPYS